MCFVSEYNERTKQYEYYIIFDLVKYIIIIEFIEYIMRLLRIQLLVS